MSFPWTFSFIVFTHCSDVLNAAWLLMLRSSEVVWVTFSLAWVVTRLGLCWWEQRFPEDGCIEGTKDRLVEAGDSAKGRPQFSKLGPHQPEGGGQLRTPLSWAALQHGLEDGLHPFSYVWWREGWGDRGRSQLSAEMQLKNMHVDRDEAF